MKNEKKTAANTAEMMTISRTEYESQQAQLAELKLQNQWLLEQLGLAKKRQFGSSSERIQEGLMDQLGLTLNEAEAYAYGTKSATPEQIAVKAHERKRQLRPMTSWMIRARGFALFSLTTFAKNFAPSSAAV